MTRTTRKTQQDLADEIVRELVRRHSTAVVLFHHALAERLGLGPTDHKCLDLLREHRMMTGSELAEITGLTTGAITGVVARLEKAGYLCREPDPHDGRKQTLRPAPEGMRNIHAVFDPIRRDVAELLERFDAHQLAAIAGFLSESTDFIYRHMALLRLDTQRHKSGSHSARPPSPGGGDPGTHHTGSAGRRQNMNRKMDKWDHET